MAASLIMFLSRKRKKIAYNTIMFVVGVVKKLAQNIGRSNSCSGNTAKSKICIHILKTELRQRTPYIFITKNLHTIIAQGLSKWIAIQGFQSENLCLYASEKIYMIIISWSFYELTFLDYEHIHQDHIWVPKPSRHHVQYWISLIVRIDLHIKSFLTKNHTEE